jgi:hypothetical protein
MARRSGKGIIIDDSTFQKKARRLAKLLKINEYDFVKEQTGLLARDVAMKTPPYRKFPVNPKSIGTNADKLAGFNAVKRDIENVVVPVKSPVARWAKKTFGNRPIYEGKERIGLGVIESEGQLRSLHQKNRGANGRTKHRLDSNKYWVAKSIFNKYLKTQRENVGISKAAFVKASLQLGAKGVIPAWVKRHVGKVSGGGRMSRTAKGAYGLIRGSAPGLSHVFRNLRRIERDRLIKAVKRLEFIGKQAAKKSGFKVR